MPENLSTILDQPSRRCLPRTGGVRKGRSGMPRAM